MISWHIEGPLVILDGNPIRIGWHKKAGDSKRTSIPPISPGENDTVRGLMHASLPFLSPIDSIAFDTIPDFFHGASLHESGIGAMIRLCESECESFRSRKPPGYELLLLLRGPKLAYHENIREVSTNAMFILQIILQT